MNDWKRKLSSRKLWSLIAALAVAVLVFFNVPGGSVEQISAIIGAFGTVIAYILGESSVDAAAVRQNDPP